MRIVKKKMSFAELYYEQFSSYDEYWRIVEQREKENAHSCDKDLKNICNDSKWVGCKSYEEAKSLLVNGWDAKVEMLKNQVKKEVDLIDDKKVLKMFNDVAGFVPIVPNAIMGLPNAMINTRIDKKKQKVIKFLIITTRACTYSTDEIICKMSKVLARIGVLERHGYRCRIETFDSYHKGYANETKCVASSVLIKSENQLFDIKRMAFPIAHSAMSRVFGFAWENSLPLDYCSYHNSGLGRNCQQWEEKNRNELLNAINENNEKMVVIGIDSDIDKIFGKVVD